MMFKKGLKGSSKALLLVVIFLVTYVGGAMLFVKDLPSGASDPGLLPNPLDLLLVGAAHVLVLWLLITRSRWHGWRLMLAVAFAYYGVVTFMAQIETWYFLSGLTVDEVILRSLFLMGLPPTLIFVPLAVVVLGKRRGEAVSSQFNTAMLAVQWVWKFAAISVIYTALYFLAGYYIAWQNPAVRAFYGGVDPTGFWMQMGNNLNSYPNLLPFQLLRGILWGLFALPMVRMLKGRFWTVALITGLFIAVPMNIGHVMPNPLIPDASVRLSHLIETASSNFVFGLAAAWLLHRRHVSLADVFGMRRKPAQPARLEAQPAR